MLLENDIRNTVSESKVVEMSDQIEAIAEALSKAQGELDTAKKDSSGYGYNYSDLASVIETARPILEKNGLAVTQLMGHALLGNATLTTVLTHKSGQFFRSESSIPIIEMKGTNSAQNYGASLSYLRRYAYQAILGMASEDNDASSKEKVSSPVKKAAKPVAKAAPKKAEVSSGSSFRKSKVTKAVEEEEEL